MGRYFNPRSREGSDMISTSCGDRRPDFNPRSREGSDHFQFVCGQVSDISIHAPVKGATRITSLCHITGIRISIHAPVKGATLIATSDCDRRPDFNPRSREGSDLGCFWHYRITRYFNPRSREGSDRGRVGGVGRLSHFNPRSREGSD